MTSPRAADQSASVHAVSSRAAIGFSAAVNMKSGAPSAQGATPASFASTQVPAVVNQPNSFAGFTPSVEESAAPAAPAAPSSTPAVDAMRDAVVAALAASGHSSASLLLGTATWKLEGSTLRIEVPCVKKKMLELTVNAAAEKIIRQELQRLGAPARFMVTPGEGVAAKPVEAPVLAGSVQEAALSHPMVKRAQEIFKAEVRSVVDLRPK